jgi:hypothetical protein
MEITQKEYDRITKIKDNDDAFEETVKLLDPYLEKYKVYYKFRNSEELDLDIFKKETKIIFGLLHYVFSTVDIDESDEEDKSKFEMLTYHTKYVYSKIDKVDINEQDKEFHDSLLYIVNYFEQSSKDMEEQYNTLSSRCDMLENFVSDVNINLKIQEIAKRIKDGTVSKEELVDDKKWCQTILKNYHKKEEVMVIIQEFHSLEKNDYKYLYNEESNKDTQKKYIRYMQIDNIMYIMLMIENKLKNN